MLPVLLVALPFLCLFASCCIKADTVYDLTLVEGVAGEATESSLWVQASVLCVMYVCRKSISTPLVKKTQNLFYSWLI